MRPLLSPEKIAQGRSRRGAGGDLEAGEALFERAQCKACVGGQRFDGVARFVEWTDIAQLGRRGFGVVDPSQREPLRAAHVRALLIDAATPVAVEECAGPFAMRSADAKKLRVHATDRRRFDFEDSEIVDAAAGASAAAVHAIGVEHVKSARFAIEPRAQNGKRIDRNFGHLGLVG